MTPVAVSRRAMLSISDRFGGVGKARGLRRWMSRTWFVVDDDDKTDASGKAGKNHQLSFFSLPF